jgi:GT2 family glycosyltransferase
MPDVAVVIGNYRGERLLPDCLASIEAQTLRPTEVVVVDAASGDRSVEVAERLGARVLRRENRGLGHLYNEGARATGAELVLLLNNDVALDERCIELLAAALAADASLFAADPRQVDWEGKRDVKARTTLSRGRLVREYIPSLHLDDRVPSAETVPTVSAHGAAMLVRRDLLLELGGFDETFFLEWEDLDLCWRAWLRGHGSVYVPEAWLRHRVGGATTPSDLAARQRSSHHNLMRFALKCLPAGTAARVILGELLRLPVHPRAIAPAAARIARELPEILRLRRRIAPSHAHFDWVIAGMPE